MPHKEDKPININPDNYSENIEIRVNNYITKIYYDSAKYLTDVLEYEGKRLQILILKRFPLPSFDERAWDNTKKVSMRIYR